jgi:DNA-binding NarL/FixJ family response regulator
MSMGVADVSVLSVLMVDDEVEILESLRRVLGPDAYALLTTTSATGALAILDRHDVDILVSDLRMPEMDGLELVTQARSRHPEVVRVLLTGHATLDSAIRAINEGAVERYLTKPWDNDELRAELRDLAEGVRASRGGAGVATPDKRGHLALETAQLSPRLRQTGVALLTGASEKEIAHQLGISIHTTHQYVKILYRHFRVTSRAEYMAKLQGEDENRSRK